MTRFIAMLFGRPPARTIRITPRRPAATRLGVEPLADRVLPATLAVLNAGILTVGADPYGTTDVQVREANGALRVTNLGQTVGVFPAAAVTRVDFQGGPTADRFDNFTTTGGLIQGGGGDDTLMGSNGNDTLVGGAGDDTLMGFGGNDTYRFNADEALGTDTVVEYAGGGYDALDFKATTADVTVKLWQGGTQQVNHNLSLILSDPAQFEHVFGGAGNDRLEGNGNGNWIEGWGGNDTLRGLDGNDTLIGGTGDDTYEFDTDRNEGSDQLVEQDQGGTDTLDFSQGRDNGVHIDLSRTGSQQVAWGVNLSFYGPMFENVTGTQNADRITGNAAANLLLGLGNNDYLSGGAGNDTILGGAGNDEVWGGDGDDLILAGAGDDNVAGGAGNDTIDGGSGDDSLAGNDGDDALFGDDGDDTLWGGYGADMLDGGKNDDLLVGCTPDHPDDNARDTLYGGNGYDNPTMSGEDSFNQGSWMTDPSIRYNGDNAGVAWTAIQVANELGG